MHTRRKFLRSSALLTLAPTVPLFVSQSVAAAPADADARALVVVELDGGNDALNTVVPFADDNYARLRPTLKLDPKRVVKLNDALGLHPALKPLDALLNARQLAVLPGVGYPNPNRSHFESMARWHTASLDPEELKGYGWLGRAMDPSGGNLFAVGGDVSPALRGRRSSAAAFRRTDEMLFAEPAARAGVGSESPGDLLAFVRRQAVGAHATADRLAQLKGDGGAAGYPPTELAERLKLTARLMKAGVGARVFYTQQSGYDTHSQQQFAHATLLGEFAAAVAAFFADLRAAKLADRVALLAFSEFGRTIKENGSAGTDHGTAGACFVAAPAVKGAVVGTMPSLTDLDGGEPKMTTDFRGVYAALLEGWLGLRPDAAAKGVAPVPLFAS